MVENQLTHIAFIMDGNGRWAKKKGLPRTLGHKAGCDVISDIYHHCYSSGIKIMSLFAFSTQNWNRPKQEVSLLFKYLENFFKKEIDNMIHDKTCIRVSGDYSKLPKKTVNIINQAIEKTKDFHNFTFNICLNYGGMEDIIQACKNIINEIIDNNLDINTIDINNFNNYLYSKDIPPIDLLIRTGGEIRISNFMLYQLAYAELMFVDTLWPDFNCDILDQCIDKYYHRKRTFGAIKDE